MYRLQKKMKKDYVTLAMTRAFSRETLFSVPSLIYLCAKIIPHAQRLPIKWDMVRHPETRVDSRVAELI